MAVKNSVQVLIGGKIITLSGYESEEYLQKVAAYMNGKMTELAEIPGYNRQPQDTRHTLLSLNIADDYFKAKRQAEMYEEELETKDKEMYGLKHDLVNGQMERERTARETAEKDSRIAQLEAKVAEQEKELDELLASE